MPEIPYDQKCCVFIKLNIDYSDEFDCEMFGVFTKERWAEMRKEAADALAINRENGDGDIEVGFGTNESIFIQENDTVDDWIPEAAVKEITGEEALTLIGIFGDDEPAQAIEDFKEDGYFTWGTGSGYFTFYENID